MLEEMQPWEWAEWQLYDARQPIGAARTDVLFAMLQRTIANFSETLNRENYPNGLSLDDFMPPWSEPGEEEEMTVGQSTAYLVAIAEQYGAIDRRFTG